MRPGSRPGRLPRYAWCAGRCGRHCGHIAAPARWMPPDRLFWRPGRAPARWLYLPRPSFGWFPCRSDSKLIYYVLRPKWGYGRNNCPDGYKTLGVTFCHSNASLIHYEKKPLSCLIDIEFPAVSNAGHAACPLPGVRQCSQPWRRGSFAYPFRPVPGVIHQVTLASSARRRAFSAISFSADGWFRGTPRASRQPVRAGQPAIIALKSPPKGEYKVVCGIICGPHHDDMIAKLLVE